MRASSGAAQRADEFSWASYPPGDMVLGGLRGPMADETAARLDHVSLGLPTPDLSAQRRAPIALPFAPQDASG